MGRQSKDQVDWRQQTVDRWKRLDAESWIAASIEDTGAERDVSPRITTGGGNV